MTHSFRKGKAAFTLIELSIVLVILALIASGIVVGNEMINQSALRRLITDKEMLQTAINSFRIKFNGLPGDLPNATRYWGISAGNGTGRDGACFASNSTTATCNGNGNSMLPCIGGADECSEMVRVMQHLSLAGLLPQAYTGAVGQNYNVYYEGGLRSHYNYRTIQATYLTPDLSTNGFFVRSFNHDKTVAEGVISSLNTYSIDAKIDDGDADRGSFLATNVTSGCVAGSVATIDGSANYTMSTTPRTCSLTFLK